MSASPTSIGPPDRDPPDPVTRCEVCDERPAVVWAGTNDQVLDALDLDDGEDLALCLECERRLTEILVMPLDPPVGWLY